jgi:hypothetical protein
VLTGPDISRYQPNWVPKTSDSFCFIKSTEGQSVTDPTRLRHAAVARESELVVGFYHFLWPQFKDGQAVSGSPQVQAKWFVDNTPWLKGDILWCDWEVVRATGTSATEAEKDAFIAEVRRLRPEAQVGLYTFASKWNSSAKHAGDALWIAHWNVTKPNIAEEYFFHQYTTNNETLDENWGLFADQNALRVWARAKIKEPEMTLSDGDITKISNAVYAKLQPTLSGDREGIFTKIKFARDDILSLIQVRHDDTLERIAEDHAELLGKIVAQYAALTAKILGLKFPTVDQIAKRVLTMAAIPSPTNTKEKPDTWTLGTWLKTILKKP